MADNEIILTPEGRQKLVEELAWREGEHDAEIIERIKVGCTVEIQEQGKDKTCAFTIVGTTETNSLEHKISNESPVGSALMGHAKGDVIEVTSPSGVTRHYTIVKISR